MNKSLTSQEIIKEEDIKDKSCIENNNETVETQDIVEGYQQPEQTRNIYYSITKDCYFASGGNLYIPASYKEHIAKKLEAEWHPPRKNISSRVTLSFKVNNYGGVYSPEICESSGMRDVDDAAAEALRVAAPFEPFPDDYKEDFILVRYAFDYEVKEIED